MLKIILALNVSGAVKNRKPTLSTIRRSLSFLILTVMVVPSWSSESPNSIALDSATKSEPLLPELLSPGERLMWGEHGMMRWTNIYPLTMESREKEFDLRRTMLTVHEVGGFVTLAAMLATATYGQLTLNGYTSLGSTHKTLASVTIASYFLTAGLSLLSPPPAIRRKEWNTISIHKGLAMVHFSGMILTPLLADGIAMNQRGSGMTKLQINRDKALVHQISGYITTVAFATAMGVITF
jgi:hypothetical protein